MFCVCECDDDDEDGGACCTSQHSRPMRNHIGNNFKLAWRCRSVAHTQFGKIINTRSNQSMEKQQQQHQKVAHMKRTITQ